MRAAWSLTLVRVPAPGEGCMVAHSHYVLVPHGRSLPFVFLFLVRATWSLTPVRVPVPSEARMVTHSRSCSYSRLGAHGLSLVRVPILGEDNMVAHVSLVF